MWCFSNLYFGNIKTGPMDTSIHDKLLEKINCALIIAMALIGFLLIFMGA